MDIVIFMYNVLHTAVEYFDRRQLHVIDALSTILKSRSLGINFETILFLKISIPEYKVLIEMFIRVCNNPAIYN